MASETLHLKVQYLENVTAYMQNILGPYQQWTNENMNIYFFIFPLIHFLQFYNDGM